MARQFCFPAKVPTLRTTCSDGECPRHGKAYVDCVSASVEERDGTRFSVALCADCYHGCDTAEKQVTVQTEEV